MHVPVIALSCAASLKPLLDLLAASPPLILQRPLTAHRHELGCLRTVALLQTMYGAESETCHNWPPSGCILLQTVAKATSTEVAAGHLYVHSMWPAATSHMLAVPCLQIMYSEGDKPVSLSEQLVRLGLGKVSLGVAVLGYTLHRVCPDMCAFHYCTPR